MPVGQNSNNVWFFNILTTSLLELSAVGCGYMYTYMLQPCTAVWELAARLQSINQSIDRSINQSINQCYICSKMRFIEKSCQPFTENHLLACC
jgi:hypothetical protein